MNSRHLLSPLNPSSDPSPNLNGSRLEINTNHRQHGGNLRRSLLPLHSPVYDSDQGGLNHHQNNSDWHSDNELSSSVAMRGSNSSLQGGSVKSLDDYSIDINDKKRELKFIKPLRSITKHYRNRSGTLPSNPKRFAVYSITLIFLIFLFILTLINL